MSKLVTKGSYMIELAAHSNLPSGVVVNHSYVTPRAGQVAVILINTINRNIWICLPLLAVSVCKVELHAWQYCSVLYRERNTIKDGFQRWKEASRPIKCLPLLDHPLDLIQIPRRTINLKIR